MDHTDYISKLSLAEVEKEKLRGLCAPKAADLLGMLKAARDSFIGFLGPETVDRLEKELELLIDATDRRILDREVPAEKYYLGGARLSQPSPTVLPAKIDIRRRDELLELIETLRKAKDKSPHVDKLLADAEAELDELLKKAYLAAG